MFCTGFMSIYSRLVDIGLRFIFRVLSREQFLKFLFTYFFEGAISFLLAYKHLKHRSFVDE